MDRPTDQKIKEMDKAGTQGTRKYTMITLIIKTDYIHQIHRTEMCSI